MPSHEDSFRSKCNDLKRRAHAWAEKHHDATDRPASTDEAGRLVHELQNYQIELEIQNEDLRAARQAQENSHREYAELYDHAPVGYLMLNGNGLIVKANLTVSSMLSVARQKLLNQPMTDFVAREDQDIFYRFRRSMASSGTRQSCELRLQPAEGALLHVLLEANMVTEAVGPGARCRLTVTDITGRRRLEEALQRDKTQWEKTFDCIGDSITIQDQQRRVVRANRAAHELFKAAPGGLNGAFFCELVSGSAEPCLDCPCSEQSQAEQICSTTISNERLGRIFKISSSPLFSPEGVLEHVVSVVRDITVASKTEADLLQARKMEAIGTLAGGIAHDFNNILAAIIGYTEMARCDVSLDAETREYLDQVLIAGDRARDLVKQILTFSRKSHETPQLLNPAPIIKEALKLMRASLPATIEMVEDISREPCLVLVHPTHVHQLLVALCTNALLAMDGGRGVLTVRLDTVELQKDQVPAADGFAEGSYVQIMVRDTGRGMDEQTVKRIFEPYFTTREVGKGSGIGLALAHGIVQESGGFIDVRSTLGRGSSFEVYFPAMTDESFLRELPELQSLPGGSEKIIAVDDEPIIAAIHKVVLERLGYKVVSCTSAEQALEILRISPHSFDLLLTDQTMPRLTGSELARQMLRLKPGLPVIICTGHAIPDSEAAALGADRLLPKPVGQRQLAETVRQLLDCRKTPAGRPERGWV